MGSMPLTCRRLVREKLNQAGNILILMFFFVLWYVPFISDLFWTLVFRLVNFLGIPLALAGQGLALFQFWR